MQLDRVSGLLYANGRYYDPSTGRFLTPNRAFDPLRPGTHNPYAPLQGPGLWLLLPLVGIVVAWKGRRGGPGRMLVLVLVVGVALVGCNPPPTPPTPIPPGPIQPTPPESPTPQPTTPETPVQTPEQQDVQPPITTAQTPPLPPPACPTPHDTDSTSEPDDTPTSTPQPSTLERFWLQSDAWNGAIKEVEFRFKVTDENPERYVLVNFIKGYGTWLSDGRHGTVKILGEVVEDNFPDWTIDSVDIDPVYWSNFSDDRWNFDKIGTDTASAYDKPEAPRGYQMSAEFKMCIFENDTVPEDGRSINASVLMQSAIECIDWEASVTHNEDGAITYP